MSTPKISLAPSPAGQTGWFAHAMAGLGVLAIVATGIAISPAATNAGHDWIESLPKAVLPMTDAVAERPRPGVQAPGRFDATAEHPIGAEFLRVVHPVPAIDPQATPVRLDPVVAHDAGDVDDGSKSDDASDATRRRTFALGVVSRLIDEARSGLERVTRGVVVTSAAR